MFWLLTCFGCWRVLVAGVFWLLACFGCWRVLVAGVFWLLACFGCWRVLVAGVFWLLACFGCWRVLVAGVFWFCVLVCALLTNSIHSNRLTEQPFVLFNLLFCCLIITVETHQKYHRGILK